MKELKGHWKRATNPKFLGAWDFEPKEERVVTFEKIVEEEVMNMDGKKEPCIVAYFKGLKPLILNKTNMKAITKATGTAFIEEWIGEKVTLYTCQVKAFGDVVDAVRVKPTKPKEVKKPGITQDRFEAALKQIEAGKYTVEQLTSKFELTAEQSQNLNPKK